MKKLPFLACLGLTWLSAACTQNVEEPRILEFQTSQEMTYVSVRAFALEAKSQDWWAAQCESRLAPTSIKVESGPSQIHYDFTASAADITRRHHARSAHAGEPASADIGLTETKFSNSFSWGGNYLVDSKTGRACMRPHLTVSLSVSPQTVFIAREFPQGGCVFKDIAAHELQHVRANQSQLEATADLLKAELERAFGNRIFYGTQQELRQQLETAMQRDWFPWAQQKLREVDAQHRAIDSAQAYARNLTICGGEVPRRLGFTN